MFQLHQIPRGSKIKVDEGTITFHHTDGMYSYCTADWAEAPKNKIHLSVMTPLEKKGTEGKYYYRIIKDKGTK